MFIYQKKKKEKLKPISNKTFLFFSSQKDIKVLPFSYQVIHWKNKGGLSPATLTISAAANIIIFEDSSGHRIS
jgi:hypothetical protein